MQEISAFLWLREQVVCSWEASDKRPKCSTIHLIATVDSEVRHDGCVDHQQWSPDHYVVVVALVAHVNSMYLNSTRL